MYGMLGRWFVLPGSVLILHFCDETRALDDLGRVTGVLDQSID